MSQETGREATAAAPDEDDLLFEVRDGIAFVTLNRPKVLNARNRRLRRKLIEAFRAVDEDPAVVVAVLTGAGNRAFSVGMDLKEAADDAEGLFAARQSYTELSDATALASVAKPVVAAINGYALGGGLELALCSDIRIASETAQFGLPEASRGIMPGSGGTQRLPRLIGESRALEMMMTGELISAAEAHRIGLANRVVPADGLMAAATELAGQIARNAPLALRLIKASVRRGQDVSLADGLAIELDLAAMLSQSGDAKEGVRAFVEKRDPAWRGQ